MFLLFPIWEMVVWFWGESIAHEKEDQKKFSEIHKNVFFGNTSSKFQSKGKYNLLKFKKRISITTYLNV